MECFAISDNHPIPVSVREVEVDDSRHRTTRHAWISRKKKFSFDFIRQRVELDLELNSLIRDDVNMYVTENNVTRLVEIIKSNEEIGTFSVNGKRYRLDPNENLVESTHFVTEIRPKPEYATMKWDTKSIFGRSTGRIKTDERNINQRTSYLG
ncbi:hypothetical protein CHS0354_003873 [Potamilus streckersoni]|uniref:Uncharacterized protein n=1 Tax=Potamilus streckersoni TaxID=2493646 RepID=A0AAE0TJU8_9BIVA|nr:hypothetical protein CHS0354_003873 [Potamilus streckersoni]